MSESFKTLDPLAELDRLACDLDFDLDFDLDLDVNLALDSDSSSDPEQASSQHPDSREASPRTLRKVRILPVGIRSLSNSPGCAPHASLGREGKATVEEARREDGRRCEREAEMTAEPSASTCKLQPIRRARAVRVDAWAVPASANWTRTHKSIRKIRRVSRSTDWALPF